MKLSDFHKIAGPFKYIMPTYFFEILRGCLSEYKNKVFWKDKIMEVNRTNFFETHNMNVSDDMTEFYFAVNMPAENKYLPKSDREELESRVLVNAINKIENGLADYGLYDLIRFNYEHVDLPDDEIYGWAVACTFNNSVLTTENVRYCYIYIASVLLAILLIIFAIVF